MLIWHPAHILWFVLNLKQLKVGWSMASLKYDSWFCRQLKNWLKGFTKHQIDKKGSSGPKKGTVCRVVPLPLWICKSTYKTGKVATGNPKMNFVFALRCLSTFVFLIDWLELLRWYVQPYTSHHCWPAAFKLSESWHGWLMPTGVHRVHFIVPSSAALTIITVIIIIVITIIAIITAIIIIVITPIGIIDAKASPYEK